MEPRRKTDTGRRQFLCGCCATLTSVGLGPSFAAAATDQAVVPVESAPFHLQVFENDYVRFLNVLIPPSKVGAYHRHSIDFAQVIVEATDRPRGHGFGQAYGAGLVEDGASGVHWIQQGSGRSSGRECRAKFVPCHGDRDSRFTAGTLFSFDEDGCPSLHIGPR